MLPMLPQSTFRSRPVSILAFLLLPSLALSYLADPQLAARETTVPAPIVISPSQDWDGNDGPWSSFGVQIGTPPQNVKVMISTAATQTWAVATEGCTSTDPSNCFDLRGRLYNYTESSSWLPNLSNLSSDIYPLGLEASLGYSGLGRYGFDDIVLGWQGSGGPTLKNQTLAGIAAKDFYLGIFGLTPRPSNFTTYNDPIPSYMENLRNQSLIPSTSWAYTAGNQYRSNNILGSLTLGGYDTSKFIPNNLTFSFDLQDARDLTVQIENISTGTGASLLPTPIAAFLDSTVPYIYLPTSACTLFESAFGLVYDDTTELYLLNQTQQDALQSQNSSITFTLGNSTSSGTVEITLPYSAFVLTASYPLVENSTKYFPLKRADNKTQYTLGRTFFQEAYVIADYERKNFSVSACKYDATESQNIVAILPPSNNSSTNSSSSSSTAYPSTTRLSTTAIAGIAAGGGVLLIAIAGSLFHCLRRRSTTKAAELAANGAYQEMVLKPELDGTEKAPEIYETDGRKYVPPAVMKTGALEIEPVYEMEAREEVASEMMAGSKTYPAEKEAGMGLIAERRIGSGRSWRSGDDRDARSWRSGDDRDWREGQRPSPSQGVIGRGVSGSLADTVSSGMSPRSVSSSVILSPASAAERTSLARGFDR